MPHLINMPRAAWRQQPSAGTDLADPGRWTVAACLNTPIYNSLGVNGIGWSTGGAPGAAFLSGVDPSEMTQKSDGVTIQNIADNFSGAEIKIAGITNGSEIIGSFVFAFKGATVVNSYIMLVADRSYNYVRYDGGTTLRAFFNARATDHTIPSLLDGRDHVLAVRLFKSTYLNRAIFLDGRIIGAQDQADTAVNGWDSTDSSLPPRIFGWQSYYNRDWNAINQFFAYTTDYLSDSELIAYTENPWQIFKPRPARFISIPISSGGTTHTLTGSGATADTLANIGAIAQMHVLVGAANTLDALADTGSVTQAHALTGVAAFADTLAETGAITQAHALVGSGVIADTLANIGAISSGAVHVLTGTSGVADCLAAAGDIIQTHALTGAGNLLDTLSATGAVSQTHALTALGAIISTLAGTISLAGLLPAPNTPQIRGVTPKFGARRHSPLFTIRSVD